MISKAGVVFAKLRERWWRRRGVSESHSEVDLTMDAKSQWSGGEGYECQVLTHVGGRTVVTLVRIGEEEEDNRSNDDGFVVPLGDPGMAVRCVVIYFGLELKKKVLGWRI